MSARKLLLGMLLVIGVVSPMVSMTPEARAASGVKLSEGGTVYVSVYSNVFAGRKQVPFELASMVVVRNTDTANSITVLTADYYDTEGKLLRSYVNTPLDLGPLATTYYYIQEDDMEGGAGANFIVKWKAEKTVNSPIIEGIMSGGRSGQGISFRTPGREISGTGE